MTAFSKGGQLAFDVLSDGQWHDGAALTALIARTYPPGRSLRAMERVRKGRRPGPAERRVPANVDRLVAQGQNRFATDLLNQWQSIGLIETVDRQRGWRHPGFRVRATAKLLRHVGADPVNTAEVRQWALANGFDVAARGTIPGDIVVAWRRAQAEDAQS